MRVLGVEQGNGFGDGDGFGYLSDFEAELDAGDFAGLDLGAGEGDPEAIGLGANLVVADLEEGEVEDAVGGDATGAGIAGFQALDGDFGTGDDRARGIEDGTGEVAGDLSRQNRRRGRGRNLTGRRIGQPRL